MSAVLRVALPVPLPGLFDYLPPVTGHVSVGHRVLVPFGQNDKKKMVGVVVETGHESTLDPIRLKPVLQVLDETPLLNAELMYSLAWAADYWLCPPGEVYTNALPLALREPHALPGLHEETWAVTDAGREALDHGQRRGKSRALLQLLLTTPRRAMELNQHLPSWRTAARRLATARLIRQVAPPAPVLVVAKSAPTLNTEQSEAVAKVNASLGSFQPFLLDGVTGSGKTEVYLAVIAHVLARGQQALLLVPEIGLAPQTLQRLRERLNITVEILHSNLSPGERARAWLRARSGVARVVLGTRSAIFTPLPHPGVLIVDEEHDSAYKQQDGFRYHARDLAVVRARALDVPVLLGSGTPSLESLANVAAGRYRALPLHARPGATQAPQVHIVDMRAQRLTHGLSPRLLKAISNTIARSEQVLVFKNRRGYAPVLLCHACGWHADCPDCMRPMTLHARQHQLICHHCNRHEAVPLHCPSCGNSKLKPLGQGTERLEEALSARFPDIPVLRIDRETTRQRNHFKQVLDTLRREAKPAILVGTQMLAKGHDLPYLTLVAIVGADDGLLSVDFRASERLAQPLVQVAGRAGRAVRPGHVLLQTHHPEHPLLHQLLGQGYAATAQDLLHERRLANLPPFSHQVLLRAEARQREQVDAFLYAANVALPKGHTLQVAGPMPAPMPLRAGRQRGQLLLESEHRRQLHQVLRHWQPMLFTLPQARRVRWSLDVSPLELY